MGYQEICENVVQDTEGALGCVVIDLNTGLTLAVSSRPGMALDGTKIRSILRFSEDMFRGRFIGQFVNSLPTNRTSSDGFVREIQTTTTYTHQFMAPVPGWDDGIVVLITEKSLSLGLGWIAVRQAQQDFAEAQLAKEDEPPQTKPEPPVRTRQQQAPMPPLASIPGQESVPPLPRTARNDCGAATPVPAGPPPPPKASEPPASQSIPNPLVAKERVVERADTSLAEEPSDDQPESAQPILSGPRAKMFKPRTGKKAKQ